MAIFNGSEDDAVAFEDEDQKAADDSETSDSGNGDAADDSDDSDGGEGKGEGSDDSNEGDDKTTDEDDDLADSTGDQDLDETMNPAEDNVETSETDNGGGPTEPVATEMDAAGGPDEVEAEDDNLEPTAVDSEPPAQFDPEQLPPPEGSGSTEG